MHGHSNIKIGEKFKFLTNCEYSPYILDLYQTGQVLAPNSARYMQELPNGGPFKIMVYCNHFPVLHNRTSKVSTHKLKSRGNNSDHVATGTLCIHFLNCYVLIYVTGHPA